MNGHTTLDRRRFLGASGAVVAGAILAGPAARFHRAAAQEEVTIEWWDQFLPLEELHTQLWEQYEADHPGVTVEYTVYNPQEMGQALQLAFSSGQMPDVHSLAGVGLPPRQLFQEGWFQPLANGAEIQAALPEGSLFEGLTIFDGQVYSFPTFSFRQYETLTWFNKDLVGEAGLDPAQGPRTWDEFRQAATAITENGGGQAFGWIQGINFVERLGNHVAELAEAAGALTVGPPGGLRVDLTTGEFAYASDPYVEALEFLASLQQDGLLFPASSTLDARTARARWATGVAGMFFDGPWNVGVIQTEFGDFLDSVGVAPIPRPAGSTAFIHRGPAGSPFWISSQSEHPDVAADILHLFTTPEYYVGLAERMDQPPLDLTAVDRAEVHPTYQQAIGFFQEDVRLAPDPIVRNPAVALVNAEMRPITPGLGEIAQGVFSGDVTDIRGTLQTFDDQLTAERERAIGVVQSQGQQVSLEDWVFANWDPSQDYTPDMYTG